MAFCMNCGQELPDGTKFCANCGKPIEVAATPEGGKRQTVYEGEIHKCPNCGEVLKSFTANCPVCGFELRGASAADSIQQFALKLEKAQTKDQKCTLVRNFPVPNTKEDILEFMILASTNIAGEDQKSVFEAWVAKFEQCYQKAQLAFSSDIDFSKIQEIYDKTSKQIIKERAVHGAKSAGGTVSKIMSHMPNPLFAGTAVLLLISELIRFLTGRYIDIERDVFNAILILVVVYIVTEKVIPRHKNRSANEPDVSSSSQPSSFSTAYDSEHFAVKEPVMPSTIKIPSAVHTAENYAVVESLLVQAGFTNVRTVPLQDLTTGLFKKPGIVDSITVNGKELQTYFAKSLPLMSQSSSHITVFDNSICR